MPLYILARFLRIRKYEPCYCKKSLQTGVETKRPGSPQPAEVSDMNWTHEPRSRLSGEP